MRRVARRDTLFTARQSRPISAPISPENVFPRAADDMKIATPLACRNTGNRGYLQRDGLRIDTKKNTLFFFANAYFNNGNLYTILEMTAHDAFPSIGDERESSIDLEGNCFRAATHLIGVEFLWYNNLIYKFECSNGWIVSKIFPVLDNVTLINERIIFTIWNDRHKM